MFNFTLQENLTSLPSSLGGDGPIKQIHPYADAMHSTEKSSRKQPVSAPLESASSWKRTDRHKKDPPGTDSVTRRSSSPTSLLSTPKSATPSSTQESHNLATNEGPLGKVIYLSYFRHFILYCSCVFAL